MNLKFDEPQQREDPTGLSLKQKNVVYDLLVDIGVPLTNDGKNDYASLTKLVMEQCPKEPAEVVPINNENSVVSEEKKVDEEEVKDVDKKKNEENQEQKNLLSNLERFV